MPVKPETKFAKKFDAWIAATYGEDVFNENIQQVGIVGTPDRLLCIRGRFVGVELKKSSQDEPTQMQMHKLKKIARAGGLALVVDPDNFDQMKALIIASLSRQSSDSTSSSHVFR